MRGREVRCPGKFPYSATKELISLDENCTAGEIPFLEPIKSWVIYDEHAQSSVWDPGATNKKQVMFWVIPDINLV